MLSEENGSDLVCFDAIYIIFILEAMPVTQLIFSKIKLNLKHHRLNIVLNVKLCCAKLYI